MSGVGPAWIRALGDLFKPRRLAAIWAVALVTRTRAAALKAKTRTLTRV
jgi:hypothetical protein